MSTPLDASGLPANEPKDGDFVAYLAEIERRQMRGLPAAHLPHTPPRVDEGHGPRAVPAPLNAAQADALRLRLKQDAGSAKNLIVAGLFGLLGLFFVAQGLTGSGGFIAMLIGAFLLWRAVAAFRKAAAADGTTDVAARLVDTLHAAQQQQQKK